MSVTSPQEICHARVSKIVKDGDHFKSFLFIRTHHVDVGKD